MYLETILLLDNQSACSILTAKIITGIETIKNFSFYNLLYVLYSQCTPLTFTEKNIFDHLIPTSLC